MVAVAVTLWFTVFWVTGTLISWLIDTYEGDTSECWWAECGTYGEFIDDHDLFSVIVLGMVATLPSALILWKARRLFVKTS
jgi:hypothetical protein